MQQKELLVQIDAIKERLLNLLTIWYKEQTEGLQQILFIYENAFGDIEFEIEQKEKKAKRLEQKYKILSKYVDKKEPVRRQTIEFIDKLLFDNDNENVRNSFHNNNQHQNMFADKNKYFRLDTSVNDEVDLTNLYRNIIKKLHPDIIGESNIFNLCWANVQFCYQKQDIERLKMFYMILCTRYVEDINNNDIVQLKKDVEMLDMYIEKQNKDNNDLKKQEPFCFKEKLDDDKWVIERKNLLRNKLVQVNKRIIHNNKLLRQVRVID